VVLVVCEDVTDRKQAEQSLLEHQAQLRALRTELSLVEARERRRIAVGLHDEIGQNLAFAKMRLPELQGEIRSPEGRQCATAIGEHLDEAILTIRTLTFELSSPVLYELGLVAAIRNLVDRTGAQNSIRFRVSSDGARFALPEDLRVLLYRATAELLLNVQKHSKCHEAEVAIETVGENLRITVRDDGVGFDAVDAGESRSRSGGYGLFNIREGLEQIEGRFEIDSAPGRGTRAVIVAPLNPVSVGGS
jgi:signal transduction histidine kinase